MDYSTTTATATATYSAGDVVDYNGAIDASIVQRGQRAVFLLSCSVPDVELDILLVDIDRLGQIRCSNGGSLVLFEVVVYET